VSSSSHWSASDPAQGEWLELGPLIRPGTVNPVTADGQPLVIWRTERGRVVVLDDRCPHQDNPLSTGTVVGERLRCATHGFEVSTDGWCDRAGIGARSHRVRTDAVSIYVKSRP
jgi:phenylpropionate dioxygenase-like ring-hydroxylating dioxygenase large terminal subunit